MNNVLDHAFTGRLSPTRPGRSTTPDRLSRAVTSLIRLSPPPLCQAASWWISFANRGESRLTHSTPGLDHHRD